MCKTLRSTIIEDRYFWLSVLIRGAEYELSRLPANALPNQDASVNVLRACVKHAYLLKKFYQCPSLDRAIIRIDTPARVTFVKLIRGRWFLVASSNTTISELSVWEILSPSTCALQDRVYFPAPILDGILDDDRNNIRLAISIASW